MWSPTMATSPEKPHFVGEDPHSWIDWQKQLQAYVAWVNSQLKKRPGTRLVEDLKQDMRDGVALVCLIEVIGKERLTGVHMVPSNQAEMLENVERVLHFMTSNRIRMHHIAPRDIVDGNLKAIMRCILALAAHFKPDSVKQSHHLRSPSKNQNLTGIAQGAAAALADARRNVARAGHRSRRNRDAAFNERRAYYAGDGSSPSRTAPPPSPTQRVSKRHLGSSSDPSGDSDHSLGRPSGPSWSSSASRSHAADIPNPGHGTRRHSDRMASSLSMADQFQEPLLSAAGLGDKSGQLQRSKSTGCLSLSKDSGAEMEDKVDRDAYEGLLEEYSEVYDAMIETRKTLVLLQDLLLSGQIPDGLDTDDEAPFEGSTPSEQIVVLKSRLQNSTEVCNDLRERLSVTSAECMELRGKTAGQQSRLTEQDASLVQLKNELFHRDHELEKLTAENRELKATVESLRTQLSEMQGNVRERDSVSRALKSEITELHNCLQQLGESGASLSARITTQDRRMAQLAGRISSCTPSTTSSENGRDTPQSGTYVLHHGTLGGAEELNTVRECLATLRQQSRGREALTGVVDCLERSMAALLEHLYSGSPPSQHPSLSPSPPSPSSLTQVTYDSALLTTRQHLDSSVANNTTLTNGQPSTKVLYFTDKSVTPFMCTIHKRLGEIRLKDFKELFENHGRYRFHFKALDPEYGTVKEEICNDDDLIPGWEGKIVAWVEEDHGTPC